MTSGSYAQRHGLLSRLLNEQTQLTGPNAFAVATVSGDGGDLKLDDLLLRGWSECLDPERELV